MPIIGKVETNSRSVNFHSRVFGRSDVPSKFKLNLSLVGLLWSKVHGTFGSIQYFIGSTVCSFERAFGSIIIPIESIKFEPSGSLHSKVSYLKLAFQILLARPDVFLYCRRGLVIRRCTSWRATYDEKSPCFLTLPVQLGRLVGPRVFPSQISSPNFN